MKKFMFQFGVSAFVIFLALSIPGCSSSDENIVVLYTSQDQVYAEPIIQKFEHETGIDVRAVYDSEATKTVGLINRLIVEKDAPRCDVFWSNEELRTRQLITENVLRRDGWTTTCFRTRRIVVNTNLISVADAPKNFQEMTNPVWREKFAMAYPQFGTTATHLIALRQFWGDDKWSNWCRDLVANDPMLVDGNSTVVKLVGAGEVLIGFTDSDDIAAGQREGLPVVSLPVAEDSLLIHNTVALVSGRPDSAAVKKLYDYLSGEAVSQILIGKHAAEGIETPSQVRMLSDAEWGAVIADLDKSVRELNAIFLR